MAKKEVLEIINAGIDAVLPKNVMNTITYKNNILKIKNKSFSLKTKRVFVVGGGKASGAMAASLEKIIGTKIIKAGVVNDKAKVKTKKIKIIKAGHPFPNQPGVNGVKHMLDLKEKYNIGKDDIIICLISGGGSALLPCPAGNITLKELQDTNKLLLRSGAEIHKINTVRKHLSRVKGGQLAKHFQPATIISILLSDVVGDDLDVIASGPTVADKTTFKQALNILKKHKLTKKVPKSVLNYILKAENETPSKLKNTYNFILGNNLVALKSMEKKAKELKLKTKILTYTLTGESSKQAVKIAKIVKKQKPNTAIILGGETTVTIKNKHGDGGRNQEYTCASILPLKSMKRPWAMASVGTDGSDFMPTVAGGVIDNNSINLTNKKEISKHVDGHDSYPLLKKLKGVVKTGATGTNVCDIIVYVIR